MNLRRIFFIYFSFCFSFCFSSKSKDFLVVAMEGAPQSLDPFSSFDAYSQRVMRIIYPTILKIDENGYPVENYGKVDLIDKTVKIYSDKIPHYEIFKTFKKLIDLGRIDYVENITFSDGVFMKLKYKNYDIFYDLTFPIPYTFDIDIIDFKRGEYILIKRGERFVLIKGVAQDIARVLEFEKGEIDVLVNAVPPYLLDYVKKFSYVFERRGVNVFYIGFNLKNRFLSRKDFRIAIAKAIDREEIRKRFFKNSEISDSILPPLNKFYLPGWYEFNPEEAKRIILKIKEEEGINEIEFVWKTSTHSYSQKIVRAISSYLERIGLRVIIMPREFGTFYEDISKGRFDIFSLNIVGVFSPDVLKTLFKSDLLPPKGLNRFFFFYPKVDEIISLEDENKYFEIQKILKDEVPIIPMWCVSDVVAIRKNRVWDIEKKKLKFSPGGDLSFIDDLL